MQARHTMYDFRLNETYPPSPDWRDLMRDEECTCDRCAHWAYRHEFPVYAEVNGNTVRVAQCLMAGRDDAAPYAETLGEESAVFTQAMSRCVRHGAFEPRPEEIAALVEEPA